MRRRLDLSIGGWLGLGFGVAALLLIFVGGIGWLSLERITLEALTDLVVAVIARMAQ